MTGPSEVPDLLHRMEALLQRRQTLWSACIYFHGASERSPTFDAEEQRAWDQTLAELHDADGELRDLATSLRRHHPEAFGRWVEERCALHGRRLAEPALPAWERTLLVGTIRRWRRFVREDFDDFYRWTSW